MKNEIRKLFRYGAAYGVGYGMGYGYMAYTNNAPMKDYHDKKLLNNAQMKDYHNKKLLENESNVEVLK